MKVALLHEVSGTIYEERSFTDLPVLADALEDAGCADAVILDHDVSVRQPFQAEMPPEAAWKG
jgi:hypothetical protein